MNLVVTGHVDHGKSTVVGRLLADTGSLPEGKLDAIRALCARNSKPFEYAFLLDALRDERAQGITIDAARVFFKSKQRDYLLLDAPGHSEFLRNMVTGAARAEAALLVIDAREGVRDNSRRHGYLLSLLGIRQLAVIVNKMDLVDRSRDVFDRVAAEYQDFLSNLQMTPSWFIPVSGMTGENIVDRAPQLPWYSGPTVLEALDAFTPEPAPLDAPFRMPVQGVYKFTANNDDRRIVAGSVATGRVRVGDELIFLPSGKQSRVKTIEAFARDEQTEASAGEAAGLTLTDHIYVGRGEIAVRADEQLPSVTTRLRASVFWLGRDPLVKDKEYHLKLGSARVPVKLDEVHRVLDVSSLATADDRVKIDRHEVADCTLVATKPLAFDTADVLGQTSRFVLVDRYQIAGGGVIREALPDRQAWVRGAVLQREQKWTHSLIPQERRAERYAQRPGLLRLLPRHRQRPLRRRRGHPIRGRAARRSDEDGAREAAGRGEQHPAGRGVDRHRHGGGVESGRFQSAAHVGRRRAGRDGVDWRAGHAGGPRAGHDRHGHPAGGGRQRSGTGAGIEAAPPGTPADFLARVSA
jgi:bifunctional enzyme CysN/CysC